MFRRQAAPPPPHTCGESRRTMSDDDCARCLLEDKLILDTQVADQKKRARTFRPATARPGRTARVPGRPEASGGSPEPQGEALLRRRTFIPPINGLDLDSKLIPKVGGSRYDD